MLRLCVFSKTASNEILRYVTLASAPHAAPPAPRSRPGCRAPQLGPADKLVIVYDGAVLEDTESIEQCAIDSSFSSKRAVVFAASDAEFGRKAPYLARTWVSLIIWLLCIRLPCEREWAILIRHHKFQPLSASPVCQGRVWMLDFFGRDYSPVDCSARATHGKPGRKLTISSRFLFCFVFFGSFFILWACFPTLGLGGFHKSSPPCAFLLARFFNDFFPGLPDHQHRCACRTWRNARVRMEAAGPAARAWALEVAAFGLEFQESRDSRYPRDGSVAAFGTTRWCNK